MPRGLTEDAGWEGSRSARSRLLPVGLAVLAVVAVALALQAGGPDDLTAGELPVGSAEDGPGGPDPGAVPEHAAVAAGRWRPLQAAPVPAPRRHAAAWTGTELVAFGAAGEVGTYDVADRRWRRWSPMPEALAPEGPRVHREPSVSPVWTGEEVLVLMGPTSDAAEARMTAAAFDPAAGRWRAMPAPPVTFVADPVSVWTGDHWIVWGRAGGPRVREDGPPVGAAYDPSEDRWRRLPEAPILLVQEVGGVMTDRGLVVWGQRPGPALRARGEGSFALRYEPDIGRWAVLDAPPLADPASAVAAWTGSCVEDRVGRVGCGQVLLWGAPAAERPPESSPAAGAALDVAEGTWSALPSVAGLAGAGAWEEVASAAAAWTEEALLVVGGPGAVGLVLDREGTWSALPEHAPLVAAALAWTGDELLVWGGYGPGGSSTDLHAWQPSD